MLLKSNHSNQTATNRQQPQLQQQHTASSPQRQKKSQSYPLATKELPQPQVDSELGLLAIWKADRIRLSSNSMTAPFRNSSDTASVTIRAPSRSKTLVG
jgi:hypothetical protein